MSGYRDPYAALGMRRNPFCVEDEPGVSEPLFMERGLPPAPVPAALRFVQLIGPKGAGKTTSLLHWRRRAPGPYRHVPPGPGRWRPLPAGSLVYWDEADRVPGPIWVAGLTAARARRATVVVGTHEDLSFRPSRMGFLVESVFLPEIGSEEVLRWAQARIRAESLGGGSRLRLPAETAEDFALEAGRDWRRVGGLLHRWAAEAARDCDRLSDPLH